MKKIGILVGALFVIGLLYFRMQSHTRGVNSFGPDDAAVSSSATPALRHSPSTPASPLPNVTPVPGVTTAVDDRSAIQVLKRRPSIEKQIPKLKDVRNEVAQNPHVTPHSLMQFSVDLSDKIHLALESKEASLYMMKQLETCASGEVVETASSASAVCIQSAYKLSAKYPDLAGRSDKIRDHADPEAQKIFKGLKKLGL